MKKILLSLLASFIIGSAVAIPVADVCNPYDEMLDQALSDLVSLGEKCNASGLSYDDFIELFKKGTGYSLRVHSLRIAPPRCAYDKEDYVEFVRPYLTQIEALDVSKSIMTDINRRELYTRVIGIVIDFFINQYPCFSQTQNQKRVKDFESQLALTLKEYFRQTVNVDHDAQQIARILDTLTVSYYQTMLFPEQQALLKNIDKVEDAQLEEMDPTMLLDMIRREAWLNT